MSNKNRQRKNGIGEIHTGSAQTYDRSTIFLGSSSVQSSRTKKTHLNKQYRIAIKLSHNVEDESPFLDWDWSHALLITRRADQYTTNIFFSNFLYMFCQFDSFPCNWRVFNLFLLRTGSNIMLNTLLFPIRDNKNLIYLPICIFN